MNEKSISNRVKGPEFFRVPSKEARLSFMLLSLFRMASAAEQMQQLTPVEIADRKINEQIGYGVLWAVVGLLLLTGMSYVAWEINRSCKNACKCCSYQPIPGDEHEMPNLVPHIDSV